MNKSELASLMLQWEEALEHLEGLEETIKEAVLENAESFTVGDIVATHYKASSTYDWEAGGRTAPPEIVGDNTVYTPEEHVPAHTIPASEYTDWKAICKEAKIDPPATPNKAARVVLKVK